MTSGNYCAIFPFCGGGKKKKDDKKTKAFYDWATTGIPVKRHFSDLKGMQYQSVILEKNIFPLCKTEIF